MKYKLVVTFLLLSCAPVQAKCHKYSRWYYPYPQRCKQYNAEVKPRLDIKFIADDKPVSVELPGSLSPLHFSNIQMFPTIEIPTDVACPYSDEDRKAKCMIKIEMDKRK